MDLCIGRLGIQLLLHGQICALVLGSLMKVALALESFDPQRGGLEQWTWQFAQALLQRGHEVHVVAFHFAANQAPAGIREHRLPFDPSPIKRAELLEKHLCELHTDITHDMGFGWFGDIFHPHGGSSIAAQEHNLLRIPAWRRIRFWREKRYREQREIVRRRDKSRGIIVCVSELVRRHFQMLHGIDASRLRVIYNGVNTDCFSPRSQMRNKAREQFGLADETVFLLVAHNLKLKNAATFLRAFAKLPDKNTRALIVGSDRVQPFVRLTKRLKIESRVCFQNAVTDMRPIYAAADVCVHPTWYDPCSLVTLEALASGLPVITSHFNGASGLMRD